MPKMLRDRAGNLYGWNPDMAKLKDYTVVDDDEPTVPLDSPEAAGIGPTEVSDYVPGQPPPVPNGAPTQEELARQPPPMQTGVQEPPPPPEEEVAKAVKKGGKRSRSSSHASSTDEVGGGFGEEEE